MLKFPFVYSGPSATLPPSLEDRRLEIAMTNDLTANAIQPTAVGRKNWLFIGAAEAGQRGAILYTIVESSRGTASTDWPTCARCEVHLRLPKMLISPRSLLLVVQSWRATSCKNPAFPADHQAGLEIVIQPNIDHILCVVLLAEVSIFLGEIVADFHVELATEQEARVQTAPVAIEVLRLQCS